MRRIALAVRLAWAALRGKLVEVQTSNPIEDMHFIGIITEVTPYDPDATRLN